MLSISSFNFADSQIDCEITT
ncbi:hypothetical protein CUMW_286100 [Citrus unshiu]|uniref:Uncharacterized protein n=1 Tax=Citrus unshiu TaxID=55188 RepID=A0A2H5N414_CITUN|nr:hypothetical protein CUMW_286100 [Citrus unshiu]